MIYDKLGLFSDAQAPTTGTTASTNVVDTGVAGRGIGSGRTIWLVVQVTTTCTSGGSNTTQAVLQDSADNSSFATVVSGVATAVASLVAGYNLLRVALPLGLRRYIRVAYVIAVADLTAGNFTAFLTSDVQDNVAQVPGFTVS
jgi:hypothetical protein